MVYSDIMASKKSRGSRSSRPARRFGNAVSVQQIREKFDSILRDLRALGARTAPNTRAGWQELYSNARLLADEAESVAQRAHKVLRNHP